MAKYSAFEYGDGTNYGKNASLSDSQSIAESFAKSIKLSFSSILLQFDRNSVD